MVCFNPILAGERRRKREELLHPTEMGLTKLAQEVAHRTRVPLKQSEIGVKAGKILGRYHVAKHFTLKILDGGFEWARREDAIKKKAELDGIYVIRTGKPTDRLSAADTVRRCKSLSQVERMFRCLKALDLLVRPIRHRSEERVPAHIFLCMLAYYVDWHMRQALAPILFEDEELEKERKRRDPILPAKPSESVKMKKRTHTTPDGLPVHDFDSLTAELATCGKVTYKLKQKEIDLRINKQPDLTALQGRAYERLLPVTGK